MVDFALRVLVVIAAAQQIVVPTFVNPFAAGAQPIRNPVPSQLEPAGYAFSIWGPIYLLALAYALWQLTPAGRDDRATERIAPLAIVLYAGSSLWLCAAKYGPLWATIPILAVMAVAATRCLMIALESSSRKGLAWWLVVLPFGLYAGWTVCATFVNLAGVAPGFGFSRFGLSVPAFALLTLGSLGSLAGALIWLTKGNLPFAATVVWAVVAIAVAGMQRGADQSVVAAAAFGAVAIAILCGSIRFARR